jgi:protocatechuate 3,4-dioxygenase beta subunit
MESFSVSSEITMTAVDQNTITEVALEQMSGTPDPRLKQIMGALVRHLHAFAREVDLKPEEWLEGIKFLTAVGQTCTPTRQEFILLSDTLGLSSLVTSLHDQRTQSDGTTSSLLGPFYRHDAPDKELGDSIVSHPEVPEIAIYGRVTDASGRGIPHALVEIWQTDDKGVYDLQKDGASIDARARFRTDSEGRYWLRTVTPLGYLIPMDGPVGDMIRAQKRHGYRPGHIHFLISAPGYREVVTALYMGYDEHIDSDTVFGVRAPLVTGIDKHDPDNPMPGLASIHFDFHLAALASAADSGRVGADPSQILKK